MAVLVNTKLRASSLRAVPQQQLEFRECSERLYVHASVLVAFLQPDLGAGQASHVRVCMPERMALDSEHHDLEEKSVTGTNTISHGPFTFEGHNAQTLHQLDSPAAAGNGIEPWQWDSGSDEFMEDSYTATGRVLELQNLLRQREHQAEAAERQLEEAASLSLFVSRACLGLRTMPPRMLLQTVP